jgi:hypothetical protein
LRWPASIPEGGRDVLVGALDRRASAAACNGGGRFALVRETKRTQGPEPRQGRTTLAGASRPICGAFHCCQAQDASSWRRLRTTTQPPPIGRRQAARFSPASCGRPGAYAGRRDTSVTRSARDRGRQRTPGRRSESNRRHHSHGPGSAGKRRTFRRPPVRSPTGDARRSGAARWPRCPG